MHILSVSQMHAWRVLVAVQLHGGLQLGDELERVGRGPLRDVAPVRRAGHRREAALARRRARGGGPSCLGFDRCLFGRFASPPVKILQNSERQ